MATNHGWPAYQFIQGNKKPILYIGGYQLLFNRIKQNSDGDRRAYFYCVNKVKKGIGCKSSARALLTLDDEGEDKFMLSFYDGNHSDLCVPNPVQLDVKNVREQIKTTIKANPTLKPSVVYSQQVDSVRGQLGDGFRQEFDQMMPTQAQINPSIYAWKRSVIPPNPEQAADIDISCPFFLTESGENICKASFNIAGNPRRRVMILTTEKVMEAGLRFSPRGVMDATFDVS